jgi:ribosomal protein S18 acetylase RimI-like enzyme
MDGVCRGFFRFELEDEQNWPSLFACGTWVDPAFRGRGLASELWRRALKRFKPMQVQVNVASIEGSGLVEAVRREFDDISFDVSGYY